MFQVAGRREAPVGPDRERAAVRPEQPRRRRDAGVERDAARPAVLRSERGRQRIRRAHADVRLEAERQPQLRLSRLQGAKEYLI